MLRAMTTTPMDATTIAPTIVSTTDLHRRYGE